MKTDKQFVETIKAIKDPDAVAGYRYKRVARNWRERFLWLRGWQTGGISLLGHSRYSGEKWISWVSFDVAWEMEIDYLRRKFGLDKNQSS
jgi:hypothetical protein